ncbi:hemin uptake protein HemP [Thalassovita aquimarina]|uniref:Hemin uptake protein HemP n=1 Tax=Thalassovita aquimarina TaxID=2785917 RepID=A0ABS5HLW2_9RHOB|nr:hemin uptake protein HemP [Thalassovita aquimarina]MBR9649593.1 hemin uptake protein HemP [Thalassovita aquimarina]
MRLHKDGAEKVALPSHPIHRAEDLTQGGNQALIVLHDQVYSLRITRAGKLILTK